jgi:integrase
LEQKRELLSPGSVHSYDAGISGFLEHLGPNAKLALGAVATEHLQDFINSLRKRGLAAKTCEIYAKVLRSAFKAARLRQLIRFDPAEGIEIPKGNAAIREPFTKPEIDLLAKAARETSTDWFTVFLLGTFTGMRLRDCCNARWEGVNMLENTITVSIAKKRGKKLKLPIHPTLRAHLEAIAGDTAEAYLAPSLANKDAGGKMGLSAQFARIMRRAGVIAGDAEHDGKRRMSSRSFHSLRHSFSSTLANAGVTPEIRMKLTGHSSGDVHKGYTHHELENLSKAVGFLPAIDL